MVHLGRCINSFILIKNQGGAQGATLGTGFLVPF